MIAVHESMTARDVCFLLADRNHQELGPNWTIVEKLTDLHLGWWNEICSSEAHNWSPFLHFSLRLCLSCFLSLSFTERTLEDHEKILDVISHWPREHNNHVLFKNNPEKYYIIKRPQVKEQCTGHFAIHSHCLGNRYHGNDREWESVCLCISSSMPSVSCCLFVCCVHAYMVCSY